MSQILGTSGGRCVQRAISIMRKSLDYEGALPKRWKEYPSITERTICILLPEAFPDHAIRVWHSDRSKFEGLRGEFEYMGDIYETTPESDNWITAFTYQNPNEPASHCVIGEPVTYGLLEIGLVWAISLQEIVCA